MTIYTPYTYLIGWSKFGRYYYGVRFAKGCHPSEFWKKYFTSSKFVTEFRKDHGEPDIIQIRKTFKTHTEACLWEGKVLKRLNVVNDDKWLNKWSGTPEHMFGGKIQSDLAKRRIKKGNHNLTEWNTEKVRCTKCGKVGQKRAMKRWHFDNCGKKYIRSKESSRKQSISMKKVWLREDYNGRWT